MSFFFTNHKKIQFHQTLLYYTTAKTLFANISKRKLWYFDNSKLLLNETFLSKRLKP